MIKQKNPIDSKRKRKSVEEIPKKNLKLEILKVVKEEPQDFEMIEIEDDNATKNYKEFYLNGYCYRNEFQDQYYAKDESDDEIYYEDPKKGPIYAHKKMEIDGIVTDIQYPAIKKGNAEYLYDREGKPIYPLDLMINKVIFPRNPATNEEMYLEDKNGQISYPKDLEGRQFYRRDNEGNEVPINNIYAEFPNGTQIYPKMANGNEFYLRVGNKEVPAIKKHENEIKPYYASHANGDQMYPREFLEPENM